MSSESLYYPSIYPEKVKAYLDGFDVKIMLTLRSQEEWIDSGWRDNIKTGLVSQGTVL